MSDGARRRWLAVTARLTTPPLALSNVMRGGRRSLAAVAGVGFSVTMVLLQLGFLQAVRITAVDVYRQMDFDVVLVSPDYDEFYDPGFFPRARLRQASALETVVAASPLYATFGLWRCPPYPAGRPLTDEPEPRAGPLWRWFMGDRLPRPVMRRELFVLGIDPDRHPFTDPIRREVAEARGRLRGEGRVLLNAQSHVDFGWQARGRFRDWELGRHAVAVVGGFTLLRGFAADGAALCGDGTFVKVCEYPSREVVNYGFLKVRPGTTAETVRRLRAVLPPDVVPVARADLLARETDHWVRQTSTGKLFSFGVLVAMVVAAAVVYQVLSNDIRTHLPEYATLKAIGYSGGRLARVVVAQALIYMVTAYAGAVVLGETVYRATEALAGIPMRLTAENLLIALALSVAVGVLTGAFSLRRLRAADPAALF